MFQLAYDGCRIGFEPETTMASPSLQPIRRLVETRPRGRGPNRVLRSVVRIAVLSALMIAGFYLALRGHGILGLVISLPVTVMITVAVAKRILSSYF